MNKAEKPLLSICMMIKNEESNLKRCLDSFLPIIHERWCELIIVDTGSTDRTVQVAREYTDRIYHDEWADDFSKHRNFAISKAEGRKIMTVDADEELCQDSLYILEDIILNPRYVEPTVFVTIHNFYTRDRSQYSQMLQPRIFENDGAPIYQGMVHNRPRTKTPYLFASNVVFNHYGYLFHCNRELFRKKNDRSLPLLIRAYEANPDDLHILTHLVKTYYVAGDLDNTIHYGEEWIKKMRSVDYNEGWFAFLEVFVDLAGAYIQKGDITGAERIEREACRYSNRLMSIYFLLGNYYSGRDDERAKEYFEIGLDIARTGGSGYEQLLTSNARIVIPEILNWMAIYHFARGEYEKAGQYINEGIRLNNNRLPLRWDIFNEANAHKRLIKNIHTKP